MNYFDRINKQLIILTILGAIFLGLLAYIFATYQFIENILTNLSASLVAAAVALSFVGYVRHKDTKEKSKPVYRLAKSSIHTIIHGTILDLGRIYGYPTDTYDFSKGFSYEESEKKTSNLVKKLKSIKHTKIDLEFDQLSTSLQSETRNKIYELDRVMLLYSFALPLEVRIKLLEVRADYRELEFVLAINPVATDLSESAKTIIALSIFKLKMSIVALYLMIESMDVEDTRHLVED